MRLVVDDIPNIFYVTFIHHQIVVYRDAKTVFLIKKNLTHDILDKFF